ncbi:AbrB/MazE/SpoVT family DNA-binding domain-containing protein [Kamptonema cortianum]|nr:AbrB/MazE/SpoVT family DNA-binding domain-containing protein [Kamptonema cortianum]
MEVTHLSSAGHVILPKNSRVARQWKAGQELIAIDVGDGILLKPKNPFPATTLEQVAGCLKYQGTPKKLEEMEVKMSYDIREQSS